MKPYKREIILLIIGVCIAFSCRAEGQDGLFEILLVLYVFSFAFYVTLGSIIIYKTRRILGYEKSKSWKYISVGIATMVAIFLFLFLEADFIPLWFL